MFLLIDYKPFLKLTAHFVEVILFGFYVYRLYLWWKETHTYSAGHDLCGKFGLLSTFSAAVLLAFAPEQVFLFRLLVFLPLSIWTYYTQLWFAAQNKERQPPYTARFRFISRLFTKQKTAKPDKLLSKRGQTWIGITVVVLLIAFGFSQAVRMYTEGWQSGARRQAKSESRIIEQNKTAVTTAIAPVVTAADSLKTALTVLSDKVASEANSDTPATATRTSVASNKPRKKRATRPATPGSLTPKPFQSDMPDIGRAVSADSIKKRKPTFWERLFNRVDSSRYTRPDTLAGVY